MKSPGVSILGSLPLVPLALCLALLAAPAPSAGQHEGSGGAAVRPVTAITMPDGVVQLTLPPDWESNARLAEDNGAPGFLHPTGTPVGENIPFWVVVDRCPRNLVEKFPALVKRVLEEGKPYDFVLQDSTSFRTADGRAGVACTFTPNEKGARRGLAFIEIPTGSLLFRSQGSDDKTWEAHRPQVDGIIRGIRYLETHKGQGQAPSK